MAAVAYVLSEREEVYATLFGLLKMLAPEWHLRAVQSDLAQAAFNAATALQERNGLWGAPADGSNTIRWF